MRVLVVSNYYPPHVIGGYEIGCFEAVEALRAAGHCVRVLTSTYGGSASEADGSVLRVLRCPVPEEGGFLDLLRRERHNLRVFRDALRSHEPDVVYIWSLWNVSFGIIEAANVSGVPVAYYVFDDWASSWGDSDAWIGFWNSQRGGLGRRACMRLARRAVELTGVPTRRPAVKLNHAQFASEFLKRKSLEAGRPVTRAQVIHWGLNTDRFECSSRTDCGRPRRLLYVGQVVPHKGVHTAIEALAVLGEQEEFRDVTLTVVGGSIVPEYDAELRASVAGLGVANRVTFAGYHPRDFLPQIYREHDIMIVPSMWEEPFGIVLLEAMASGLVVIGTATGGSGEILQHKVNGLTFEPGKARDCADRIARLCRDREFFEELRAAGLRTVEERFPSERTHREIEVALGRAVRTGVGRRGESGESPADSASG